MLSDSSVLIGADRVYVESDGSFRALALSLLTSDAFLYRKTEPSAATASSPSHSDRTNHE